MTFTPRSCPSSPGLATTTRYWRFTDGILRGVSPVRSNRPRSQRSMVLAVSGLVFALVLVLLVFIFAIPNLTSSGKVEPHLGPERFDAGLAPDRSAEIDERGPILLPDVAGNARDV